MDTVEQQLESSDTEQDISPDEDDSGDVSSEQHIGKDGLTNWKKSKSKSRTRAHNIVLENQVLTRDKNRYCLLEEFFSSDDMFKEIACSTNKYIEAKKITYRSKELRKQLR